MTRGEVPLHRGHQRGDLRDGDEARIIQNDVPHDVRVVPLFFVGSRVTHANSQTKWNYRYQYQAYVQRSARTVNGVLQTQIEWCSTGGFDGQNGWRSFYNATVVTVQDTNANRRIGLAHDSASNDATANASINIAVSSGPVTISGSIPTGGSGTMNGGYGRPKYASAADAWSGNDSWAGWRSGCTYSRTCGSPNYQAQVHQSLFEYPNSQTQSRYVLDAQFNYYCSGPYGQGCG